MITVAVMYPQREGATFDMDYYCNVHMKLVRERLGASLKALQVEQGIRGNDRGLPAAYIAIGRLTFESVESFQTSFGPHVKELMGDIPNFTNIQPSVEVGEIRLSV